MFYDISYLHPRRSEQYRTYQGHEKLCKELVPELCEHFWFVATFAYWFFSKTEHFYSSDIFKLLSEIRQILRVTTAQQTMTPVLSAGQCTENAECDPKNYAIKGCDILHLPPLSRTCLHPSHILYILTKFEQISRHSYHQAIFSDPVAQMKNPKKLLSEIKNTNSAQIRKNWLANMLKNLPQSFKREVNHLKLQVPFPPIGKQNSSHLQPQPEPIIFYLGIH